MTTEHQVVLTKYPNQEPDNVRLVLFTSDETAAGRHPESYWMEQGVFQAFGEPDKITVTVVPGDTINDEDQVLHRSAETGQFVTEGEALQSPETTVTES